MNLPANVRKAIYIGVLVVSLITAVVIVAGVVSQEQVYSVIDIAKSLFAAFASVLALINLTPDE